MLTRHLDDGDFFRLFSILGSKFVETTKKITRQLLRWVFLVNKGNAVSRIIRLYRALKSHGHVDKPISTINCSIIDR